MQTAAKWLAWRCRGSVLVSCAILALVCLTTGAVPAEPTAVRDVRIAPHGDDTRVVIELNRRVSFRYLTLDGPPRLAIDLPEVAWQVARGVDGIQADGLVTGYRFGQFRPGVSRIVLDIAEPFEIRNVFELPPDAEHGHRIVTDLAVARASASSPPTPPDGQPAPADQQTASLAVVRPPAMKPKPPSHEQIVVIDPGHGGIDPGAIGTSGTLEKDVVLNLGLELRRRLEATRRYKVVMTRDTDRIIRLRDRLQVAHDSRGQLFLSLHADSLVSAPDVRGAAVYTLSEKASNEEAARLATKENRADILAGIDLSNQEDIVTEILIDLAQRDANNKSIQVADDLVSELADVTKMARHHRSQAGFVVLKSPDMPSAMIELGYLSNPDDEKALRDPAHLATVAEAIVKAIDRYFASEAS